VSGGGGASAPELRIDQLTGLPVILAPGRAERPEGFVTRTSEPKGPDGCPFCEGREERTPPEVYATRPGGGEADTPGWTTRVVPNLYPALAHPSPADAGTRPADAESSPADAESSPADANQVSHGIAGKLDSQSGVKGEAGAFATAGDPLLASRRAGDPDLFSARPATGAHEVIVNGPAHATAMAELEEEQLAAAVETWRARMRAHAGASYVQLIVNEGGGAGASLEHTHAQLYALDFVPAAVARERERVGAYAERTQGGSLLSDVLVEEVRRRERLVAIDDEAALICPWASRSPFELRVVPRTATASFADDTIGAAMIGAALRLLAERFDGPPELNLWVRTAPRGAEHFHWHVDIAPRLSVKAAFELATGVDIVTYPPERAAADLRELL
jgi:UDPglucose--hexose-1-phosphate uridylyltransferase